jgi:hypothetical protein
LRRLPEAQPEAAKRFALGSGSRERVGAITGRVAGYVPESRSIAGDRGKTVTKLGLLSSLGLALSEKQIPQVVENLESGDKRKEALERTVMRPRQVRYQAALRPDI